MASLKVIADKIAQRILKRSARPEIDEIRDIADTATAGDLDTVQLDILTDMIKSRLAKAQR